MFRQRRGTQTPDALWRAGAAGVGQHHGQRHGLGSPLHGGASSWTAQCSFRKTIEIENK